MTIPEAFQKLKSNLELNPTFSDLVSQKHNAVRSALQNIDKSIKTSLIGSLGRRTRIQPRKNDKFDIDILVVFGEFHNWVPIGGVTPDAAMSRLSTLIGKSERYGSMSPAVDSPTVTFEYKDEVAVELVPAYLDCIGHSPNGTLHQPKGRAYWIPKNGVWVLADYDNDAEHVSTTNGSTDQWLIPTIKMLKALRRLYFPRLSSFHLEIIASNIVPTWVSAFKNHGTPLTYPILINAFFKNATAWLDMAHQFPGSNTQPIVLLPNDREEIAQQFAAISTYCSPLDGLSTDAQNIKAWRDLFGDVFPAA